ncbi:hypothetical protein JCM10207_006417 [Rhodosporidiobolus poonsookiae]
MASQDQAQAPQQRYIKPDTVAQWITDQPKRDDYLIIDVRSSDFPGGNLPGAVNITTKEFRNEESLDRLIQRHILPHPSLRTIVVHCMRSQTRGPYAAYLLSRAPSLPKNVDVVILEGGFQGWLARFRGRGELFEGLLGQDEAGVAGREEWEATVGAKEGEEKEAEDSRTLRGELRR